MSYQTNSRTTKAPRKKEAHAQTLFHLVPVPSDEKEYADFDHCAVLRLLPNVAYVSESREGTLGIEIGYHVPQEKGQRTVTRVGRTADVAIGHGDTSVPNHFFDIAISPITKAVVLKIRCAGKIQLELQELSKGFILKKSFVYEEHVLEYAQSYILHFRKYQFKLVWVKENFKEMWDLVQKQYEQAEPNATHETAYTPEDADYYYKTRIPQGGCPEVTENKEYREFLGEGGAGSVWKTIDLGSANEVAVKETTIQRTEGWENRAKRAHDEIKFLRRCNHEHIISIFSHVIPTMGLGDETYMYYMPIRTGSLKSLVSEQPSVVGFRLIVQVLHQMLQALDYLDNENICHRDMKPANILYLTKDAEKQLWKFQLADFGLAQNLSNKTSSSGTLYFRPPETEIGAELGSNGDVWSLYATLVAVLDPKFLENSTEEEFHHRVCGGQDFPVIKSMARRNPEERPSAPECTKIFFLGRGRVKKGVIPRNSSAIADAEAAGLKEGQCLEEFWLKRRLSDTESTDKWKNKSTENLTEKSTRNPKGKSIYGAARPNKSSYRVTKDSSAKSRKGARYAPLASTAQISRAVSIAVSQAMGCVSTATTTRAVTRSQSRLQSRQTTRAGTRASSPPLPGHLYNTMPDTRLDTKDDRTNVASYPKFADADIAMGGM